LVAVLFMNDWLLDESRERAREEEEEEERRRDS
jgi:hypothetical protein